MIKWDWDGEEENERRSSSKVKNWLEEGRYKEKVQWPEEKETPKWLMVPKREKERELRNKRGDNLIWWGLGRRRTRRLEEVE